MGSLRSEAVVPREATTPPEQRTGRHLPRRPRPAAGGRTAPRRAGAGAGHPNKSVGHFRPRRGSAIDAAVEAIASETGLATTAVCDRLEVSRSADYAWLDGEPTAGEREREAVTETIRALFWRHRRRYGARRLAAEREDRGIAWSPRRVAKVLRNLGLRSIPPKSFVPTTTESRHGLGYRPNRLRDAPEPTRVDELGVGDLTDQPLRRGRFFATRRP
jgi:hypothetical protein